jgi:predicted transcriptional regulator of viral defense system
MLDDGWVLVPTLFVPGYVGGRTAAEHWDLTEQIFKDIVVITGRPIRHKTVERQGFQFTLKHLTPEKIFGTTHVWRHHTKVLVSDVHRTIVDILDDPPLGGGIQHIAECLSAYFKRSDRNDQKLIDYTERLGNGAVFKRLGFLAARMAGGDRLTEMCHQRLSSGIASLDPTINSPRIISRWRLRIPEMWAGGGAD